MNFRSPLALAAATLAALASGCAPRVGVRAPEKERSAVLRVDNERSWERREEGAFVVYAINMSGAPPFTRVVVADEAAKSAFLSLYPPQALRGERRAEAGVQTLAEYEKELVGTGKEAEAVRVLTELKTHTAVVFDYLNLR